MNGKIVNTYSSYVNKKYEEFIEEKGYIPEMFNPYNKTELKDLAPTLTAQGDSITKSGTVLMCDATKQGVVVNGVPIKNNTCYGKYLFQSDRFQDKPTEEISTTLKAGKVDCGVIYNLKIRKLTPKECWRLMGFDDADFEKAEKVNSNTQLYKQAGNSIVVNVLEAILKNLL